MVTVSEPQVQIAVAKWFWAKGLATVCFSMAAGSPDGRSVDRSRLERALLRAGYDDECYTFCARRPDIVVFDADHDEEWLIECKGAGAGKVQTQRNNFDRALASAVSYCGSTGSANAHLGLAMPTTPQYLRELSRRVRPELRRRLDLWIFLVNPRTLRVSVVRPEDELAT
jgi:hypothetical protein